jgi:NADH-quinone oxidoreductase subunit N
MSTDFFLLMKPELSLAFIILFLLFLKIQDGIKNNIQLINLTNFLLLLNFLLGFAFNKSGELFNGMYYTNSAIALEKNILNLGTLIISLQSVNWLKTHKHLLEFYILLLSTVLGMFYMISSGNFLMFYLGLELASIPLAALVNFDLEKKKSAEGAFKLLLTSAFASGIMLFGISILYGITGSISFTELPALIKGNPLEMFSLIFIFSGFAFKLSAVPFHF